MKKLSLLFTVFLILNETIAQQKFPTDPYEAEFITSDIDLFWTAFDQLDNGGNPFKAYLEKGSQGVQDFIKYRIENARNLKKVVTKRKSDYEAIREASSTVKDFEKEYREIFSTLKEIYPEAVFPPTYFVMGAFNSGGTASENGVIMGVEMQSDMSGMQYIVAHEIIHFNQGYDLSERSLLVQSLVEGSADFVGELISGKHINEQAWKYGLSHEEELCKEFVSIMLGSDFKGWLYGGNKTDRPNDLGYWMGYMICQSYYEKATDKQQAVKDILNIQDANLFLKQSGYLDPYL